MALGRIAYLNPELFAEITERAAALYEEQIEDSSFELQTLRNIGSMTVKGGDHDEVHVRVWIEREPEPEKDDD